tara:strand:- start:782 stop:1411 length:630 start_codon:yes stop_codon:yes gene_type:complete
MIKIGITQRVHYIKEYKEYRDQLDQKWSEFFSEIGILQILLPNNSKLFIDNSIDNLKLNGVILSGGEFLNEHDKDYNDGQKRRDEFENSLVTYCIKEGIPILGICRGMQFLNNFFGGKIRKVNGHVASSHKINNFSEFSFPKLVNSFHNYGINHEDVPSNFEILATDQEGNVEAFSDKKNNLMGIMWHPERNNPFEDNDIKLIKKIFNS